MAEERAVVAVVAERLARALVGLAVADAANHVLDVETAGTELLRERGQEFRMACLVFFTQIVHRVHKAAPEVLRPEAIHERLRKERIRRRGEPVGQHRSVRLCAIELERVGPEQLGSDVLGRFGNRVPSLPGWASFFADADRPAVFRRSRIRDVHLVEELSQAPILGLLPMRERMVVALGTLNLHAQEQLADAVGHLVHAAIRHEVSGGPVLVEVAGGRHELEGHRVPVHVGVEFLGQPIAERGLVDEAIVRIDQVH